MVKFTTAIWAARAYLHNLIAEWLNTRLENKKRRWTAYKLGGGGVVPLGKITQEVAINKVSNFGSISYVDTPVACIFYNDKYSQQ